MNNAEEILKNFDWGKYPHLKAYSKLVKVPSRDIVGRDKEIRAIRAAFNRPELCNVCLLAPAGSGKALADDEMIAVNDARGYVRMGDLKVGDMVFDEHGDPTTVMGVFPQGVKPAYRVTFANGASLICNDEHLWNARTAWGHKKGYEFETITLREMMERGIRRRKVRKSTGAVSYHKEWYIPTAEAVHREAADLPVDPYVVGAFIGDGCMSGQKYDNLVFSSDDTYVVDKVSRLLGGVAVRNKANYNWQLKNIVDGTAVPMKSADVFADEMFEHTLRHTKSIDRSIPEPYLLGSVEQRRALLNGLMDTDGCVTNGYRANVSFSTNSEALCMDVVRLASSLGYTVSHTRLDRSDEMHANTEYEVHFGIANERKCELFTLPRQLEKLDECLSKRDFIKFNKHFEDIGIASVEYLGVSLPMTCIYVDAPSHLFQAGYDHIVTHNTALVQGTMMVDLERIYLEVDLAKMIADCQTDVNEMASKIKSLFDETADFVASEGYQIVLFIDEFHQIVQLSAAAVEALKPLLADSGRRGIRVIVATTLEEFNEFISSNQPLVERLLRINVPEPDERMTVSILKGMAKTYGVDNQFYDDHVFHMIYEYTNRYIPASSQPRKSIKVLDAMIGWHLTEHRPMDDKLLADVIQESEDVNIAFRVDASSIKKRLDEKVLAQDFASEQIARRLQLCVADLNNPDKPMSTMLFTGSTGCGKTEMTKQLADILFGDQRRLLRFDMTEYANNDSLERFRDLLTTRIWEHPYSIVLLDEIEKACAPVTRLLLQVLDDGRLTNRNNREVSFTNCYIIITTNAGSEIYKTISQYGSSDEGSAKMAKQYDKLIRRSLTQTSEDNKFPPELIGRIDVLVPFQPLSRNTMKAIVEMKLKKLKKMVMDRHGVDVRIDKRVIDYLVEDNLSTDSDSGGARVVVSKLESEVTTEVARFLNENEFVRRIAVKVEGQMAIENKNKLESEAYIKVLAC